jgi:hypothetical protein
VSAQSDVFSMSVSISMQQAFFESRTLTVALATSSRSCGTLDGRPMQYFIYPAAQASSPSSAPSVGVDSTGRITGVDGMLDQIASALAGQVRTQLLPVVQQDRDLQRTIGAAAGQAAAQELKPWVVLGAGALAAIAVVGIVRLARGR